MKLAIIIVAAIIIGSVAYFVLRGRFHKRNRIIVGVCAVILLGMIGIYTFIQDSHNKLDADIIAAFNRGESLQCGEISVNSENFNFIGGTLTFVGKKNSAFLGKIVPIKECY